MPFSFTSAVQDIAIPRDPKYLIWTVIYQGLQVSLYPETLADRHPVPVKRITVPFFESVKPDLSSNRATEGVAILQVADRSAS